MTEETFIEKVLVISTSHVTAETAKLLDKGKCPGVISYSKGDYGWLVFVPGIHHEAPSGFPPDDMHAPIDFAAWKGCGWLMFDRDAATHPDLPAYEW